MTEKKALEDQNAAKDRRADSQRKMCFSCRLLWSALGELILVMEQDPWCLIDNLYGECELRFLETIDVELSKE
ncbi:unnamed protein product [Sphagnum troendelagicum]|uniref:Uncharacterized protein n=1 Tax=Sphagnum troendelagicum TaxID=128251 RepID=A0ABP0V0X9_9BRYO